jgi:hypothetical protein
MTTTDKFQKYPDYYQSIEECKNQVKIKKSSNPRYKSFTQLHFHAGDEEQFQEYRDMKNGNLCVKYKISLKSNIFRKIDITSPLWEKYHNLNALSVQNTFRYIFNKLKKGIFIKIENEKLVVFLPFSKKNFINEWSNELYYDPKYKNEWVLLKNLKNKEYNKWIEEKKRIEQRIKNNGYLHSGEKHWFENNNKNWKLWEECRNGLNDEMHGFLMYIHKLNPPLNKYTGKPYEYDPCYINQDSRQWYANNFLFKSEKKEGDTNNAQMKDMLIELCKYRKIPDIEFFMNRRDFPILKKNNTEPYDEMFGKNRPLISNEYKKYSPILSMVTSNEFADIPIPTGDDWGRISELDNKIFPQCETFPLEFNTPWNKRKEIAMFRGASTGCGVTIDTNMRLKVAYMSSKNPIDEDGTKLLDAGITKWNPRPRKLKNKKYVQTIDFEELERQGFPTTKKYKTILNKKNMKETFFIGYTTAERIERKDQDKFKYIINIDGHVSAFRLSLEMNTGSCVLLVDSPYILWFRSILKPYEHFIPVKEDLSDLLKQIKWCKKHDKECEQIAQNAKKFYNLYLQKDGILDYMQKLFINLKEKMGIYVYNSISPLNLQIEDEYRSLKVDDFPIVDKTIEDIMEIPTIRNYNTLRGIEFIVNMIIKQSDFKVIGEHVKINTKNTNKHYPSIFKNKLGEINLYRVKNYHFVVKTSNDKIKQLENIHETYLGKYGLNELSKNIPNFAYIFGYYGNNEKHESNIITEYIDGISFTDYIKSKDFNMKDYIFILYQLTLALYVAQNKCGFVHWDLAPWNIMIKKLKTPETYDYVLGYKIDNNEKKYNRIIKITTNIIPVIIDYGKSHIICNEKHHGFINMYKMSTIQDIKYLIIKSVSDITENSTKYDKNILIELFNFIAIDKEYTNYQQIVDFLKINKNYSASTNNTTENMNTPFSKGKGKINETNLPVPIRFLQHLSYINKKFKLGIKLKPPFIDIYENKLQLGNSRQVFDFILSSTLDEKIQSYLNVFIRAGKCKLPIPQNILIMYYAVQQFYENLTSVYLEMKKFLIDNNLPTAKYDKIYEHNTNPLYNTYTKLLNNKKKQIVDYKLPNYIELIQANYDEYSFSLPDEIYKKLINTPDIKTDISEYKYIIEMVFLNTGRFALPIELKEFYFLNFKDLLIANSLFMKNNIANIRTLKYVSKKIYTIDQKLILKNNCEILEKIEKIYIKIIKIL